eukprot:TRINITY_DN22925_c0_g1_i1.p1 TRINITY_DN22925_c0_g1~~TRINITY_DN22925_c0_g1_i1.p1  ORF type:complete len:646 (+),score=136.26 TRINITY_DN22925_c0_g1_i1:34-1971(+)
MDARADEGKIDEEDKAAAEALEAAREAASLAAASAERDTFQDISRAFNDDPRRQEIAALVTHLSKKLLMWQVIGGGKDGGLVVRADCSLKSLEMRSRLATGSIIRETFEKGDRIHYQLLQGSGPSSGWVSVKVKNTEMLASVSTNPNLLKGSEVLIRRLAMMPVPFRNILTLPVVKSQRLTERIYARRTGCLDVQSKCSSNEWQRLAQLPEARNSTAYPSFPADDQFLLSLLTDSALTPIRRIFLRPGAAEDESPKFVRSLDPANGLMPDMLSVAYFLGVSNTLRGAARFGPQSSQSMGRLSSEDEGEFHPGVHGGAEGLLLADAAIQLCRLRWHDNATLKKISCQFSKPCPCFQTLEVIATIVSEQTIAQFQSEEVNVKVRLHSGKTLIAFADVLLVSFPIKAIQLPSDLPRRCDLAPSNVDWVPQELACARLPANQSQSREPFTAAGYMRAALDMDSAMKFPRSCAAVEDVTTEEQLRQIGIAKCARANQSFGQGGFRNDLCFPGGLAPAAISFEKYYDGDRTDGTRFLGTLKFGPQASEAVFLSDDEKCDGSMSLVAHIGMPLAALDDFLAHLPRCDGRERNSITWKLEMETHHLVPLGHELQFECFCPYQQKGAVGHSVSGEITYEGEEIVTESAVITSRR